MVKDSKNLVVGLDVGTSKIVAIVAEIGPEGELNVIGLGTQPSRGLKRGKKSSSTSRRRWRRSSACSRRPS